eukprot:2419719-Pyramimonas_sp.AAC.1
MVVEAPFVSLAKFDDARVVAGHVHWGAPKSIVMISVYLHAVEGWSDRNFDILAAILRYSAMLNVVGMDW